MANQLVTLPEPRRTQLRPLRWWWVSVSVTLVIGAGIGVGWWLWTQSRGLAQPALAQARTDAIRTGLTAAGGTGSAAGSTSPTRD